MSNVLIILPAFNEEASIERVIYDLLNFGYKDILVVDDGSTDNTVSLVQKMGVKVVKLPYNMGAWKALQTGMRYALIKGYRGVVTMDSDGQHKASEINKLLGAAQGRKDVVIGSCLRRGSKTRLFTWKLLNGLSGLGVNDITSGFRYYGRAAVFALSSPRATMLDYQDIGVLFFIRSSGLSYVEVDVEMSERSEGVSKIFNSWMAVTGYMSYTLILTVTKVLPIFGRRQKIKMQRGESFE